MTAEQRVEGSGLAEIVEKEPLDAPRGGIGETRGLIVRADLVERVSAVFNARRVGIRDGGLTQESAGFLILPERYEHVSAAHPRGLPSVERQARVEQLGRGCLASLEDLHHG